MSESVWAAKWDAYSASLRVGWMASSSAVGWVVFSAWQWAGMLATRTVSAQVVEWAEWKALSPAETRALIWVVSKDTLSEGKRAGVWVVRPAARLTSSLEGCLADWMDERLVGGMDSASASDWAV